ncbi:hypothetical protein [Laspinema sp. D2d]|uniref:hypothetical protein n=1 Tax=Laspinema sp. D2d TaxID=2953686 RepID=UPI0021BAFC0F|nr:hypothetical protein [Laspinema sp. D2d]
MPFAQLVVRPGAGLQKSGFFPQFGTIWQERSQKPGFLALWCGFRNRVFFIHLGGGATVIVDTPFWGPFLGALREAPLQAAHYLYLAELPVRVR